MKQASPLQEVAATFLLNSLNKPESREAIVTLLTLSNSDRLTINLVVSGNIISPSLTLSNSAEKNSPASNQTSSSLSENSPSKRSPAYREYQNTEGQSSDPSQKSET